MTRKGTRWEEFTDEEFHLLHHALRMLAKYPGIGADGEAATKLADEIWNLHAIIVAAAPSSKV